MLTRDSNLVSAKAAAQILGTTARKYSREFYVKIGRKGGQRVKELK